MTEEERSKRSDFKKMKARMNTHTHVEDGAPSLPEVLSGSVKASFNFLIPRHLKSQGAEAARKQLLLMLLWACC